MKKQAAELLRIAKKLVAEPMTFDAPSVETKRWGEKTLKMTLNVDSSWKKLYESMLTFMEGTSNKFHYFAVYRSPTGECVGGNAYGRIGYNPKAIEIARGNYNVVINAVRGKVMNKQRKGYEIAEV